MTLRFDITLSEAVDDAILAFGFSANSAEWYIDNVFLTPAYLGNPGFETTYNWSKNGGMDWAQDDAEGNVHGVLNLGNIHLLQTLKKNFISAALKRL